MCSTARYQPGPASGPGSDPRSLLTAEAAATFLAISERKLWELTNRGEISCVRIGRSVRYDPGDLRAFIERRKGRAAMADDHAHKMSLASSSEGEPTVTNDCNVTALSILASPPIAVDTATIVSDHGPFPEMSSYWWDRLNREGLVPRGFRVAGEERWRMSDLWRWAEWGFPNREEFAARLRALEGER